MVVRRLRGISFERAAAPEERVLPRMDVVGFVGLAASGPVDVPVPIENTGQFAAIFGDDLRVSTGTGGVRRSFLGAAVRAFFANGGRRCWIVRVVGPGAASARFVLPGVRSSPFAADPGGRVELVARSPGSWADALEVSTTPRIRWLRLGAAHLLPADDGVHVVLHADVGPDAALVPGDLLALRIAGERYFAPVERIGGGPRRTLRTFRVVRAADRTAVKVTDAFSSPAGARIGADVCSFDLHLRAGARQWLGAQDLAFHPMHPRHWRSLPDDVALFAGLAGGPLSREVAEPRLPVAGRAMGPWDEATPLEPATAWEVPDEDFGMARWESAAVSGPAWVRDGVTAFDPALLLDAALLDASVESLPRQAADLQYLRPRPRRLRGAHALLSVEEVTLVALPDVVQPPWGVTGALAAPLRTLEPAQDGFQPCGPGGLAAPVWELSSDAREESVRWDTGTPSPRSYRVERSDVADFQRTEVVLVGRSRELQLDLRAPRVFWLRVRAESDDSVGPWSRALKIEVPPGPTLHDRAPVGAASVVAVQRAVLRMCAARGDLVALLSTPDSSHGEPLEHAQRLRAREDRAVEAVAPLSERRALTHGGLWGPWLLVREDDGELRSVPPEGAVAGFVAHLASESGAWIAPANVPLREVIAASRPLDDAQTEAWLDAGIQVIRREPWGLVTVGARTLADPDDEVQHLHVRRLLALLRRLALRHGQDWVFEPQSSAFVRGVAAGFEVVMRHLHGRGAFASDRPESAYSVRVQPNPAEAERGRFVVELRVAPAMPLRFLTVRLVQDEARGLIAEGV